MRKQINLGGAKHVHFIGIGGISMSGLAEILLKDGFEISGSDQTDSPTTKHLHDIGIKIMIGCDPRNISADTDLVVYTAAIKPDNLELAAARSRGIPTMVRAELLGAILQGYEYAVCVAGTHGKTSTTAMITEIALAAGLDPTVNIGGYIGGTNYYIGSSPYFVLEACEYSNSFHHWHPYIGVILNVDADHLDFFGNMEAIIEAFARFARNIRPEGMLVIGEGVPGFERITAGLECQVITFGGECNGLNMDESTAYDAGERNSPLRELPEGPTDTMPGHSGTDFAADTPSETPRYWARDINLSAAGRPSFDVMEGTDFMARVTLPLPGRYNMYNALAAFAVARRLGVSTQVIAGALSQTKGVKRRYEYKGTYNGAEIIDDYAHTPTEIKSCLAAARTGRPGRIICLFQPHTYTRTRDFFEDFTHSFAEADITAFVPIFAAREPYDPTISSAMLCEGVASTGKATVNFDNLSEAETWLRGKLMPGDLLITMGAGDVYLAGERLLST